MKFILASGSARRKELLQLIVPEFEVIVSGVEEKMEEGLTLQEQVANLAHIKAKYVYDHTAGDRIVIGSDTMVTKNGEIYGKPKNREDAKKMLKELTSGDRKHTVMTGLSIIIEKNGEYKEYKTYDEAEVYFTDMTDEEIEKWIDTGKALYAIQEEFIVFVDRIEGNYATVIGFPTHKVYQIIKEYL